MRLPRRRGRFSFFYIIYIIYRIAARREEGERAFRHRVFRQVFVESAYCY